MQPNRGQAEDLLVVQRDLGIALSGAVDLSEALDAVLDAAFRVEGIDSGGIYLVDGVSGDVRLAASRGLTKEFVESAAYYPKDSPNARFVMEGRPRYVSHREFVEKEMARSFDDVRTREGIRTFAGVPIVHHGKVVGCLNMASHEQIEFPETSRQALESIASRVGSTIMRIRAEEMLRESEERYRTIFEKAMDGILLANVANGRFLSGNRRICEMLGYGPDELKDLSVADIHPENALPAVGVHFQAQILNSGHLAADVPVLRRDGSVFYADIVAGLVTLHGERYLVGIFRDVSERRKAEAEREKAQRLEALGVLAGGIAHDFNNLLTAIAGNVSLARLRSARSESVTELLDDAEKAAYRARDLTQQLLTFAKGGHQARRTCTIGALVADASSFILRGSNAQLALAVAPDLWPIEADIGQIGQVVQNLVLNAAQSMPEGGVVSVTAENVESPSDAVPLASGRHVRISVVDRGCGIPADNIQSIFDPYFTTKNSGSGLGLAVAQSIVRSHGGRIEVVSEVGAGSSFVVLLPVASRSPAEPSAKGDGHPQFSGRVLLMDDDESIRVVASKMLEELGCRVTTVSDGALAVDAWCSARRDGRPFDVCILDLTIPGGMGGIGCVAALKHLDPAVQVIVSSGYSTDPVLSDPTRFGFAGVICKPYLVDDLRTVLARISWASGPNNAGRTNPGG